MQKLALVTTKGKSYTQRRGQLRTGTLCRPHPMGRTYPRPEGLGELPPKGGGTQEREETLFPELLHFCYIPPPYPVKNDRKSLR